MRTLLIGLLLSWCPLARAAVMLPDIFSDHAVLQKSAQTVVWGTAAPDEAVVVTLGPIAARPAMADGQGKWRVELNLAQCGVGPFDLTCKGSENTLVVHDVLVGELWIASGQSNMEFKLGKSIGGPEEVARSANANLRCFLPKQQAVPTPADTLSGRWLVAGPTTSGDFSGVAYYFAKTVQAALHVPVGWVDTSVGGSPAEAWISAAGMDRDPGLKARKDATLATAPHEAELLKQFGEQFQSWAAKYHRQPVPPANPAPFADPAVSTADWKTVTLPGELGKQGLPDNGVVWLRREVELPDKGPIYTQPLFLGTLHDFETVYCNGKKVGETTPTSTTETNLDLYPTTERRYNLPPNALHAGLNTLAIRLASPGGGAGQEGSRFLFGTNTRLAGKWQAKVERESPPLPPEAAASYPHRPPFPAPTTYNATYLFNGETQPLTQLTLRGVLWFQGEANVSRAYQFRTTFPLLIEDWREHFHRPDLPFYFGQISNFMTKQPQPGESNWAELRESQARTLSLPHTGMAVLFDIGEEDDIHFRDRQDPGERLAAIALAKTYGQNIPDAGPTYEKAEVKSGQIVIHFSEVDGGLVARPLPAAYQPRSSAPETKPLIRYSPESELQGFAVCGDDRQWKWANAKIEGDVVIVSSPEVPAPKFVRYGWANNPTCNLYNKAGFPAGPFRTDAFEETTAKTFY